MRYTDFAKIASRGICGVVFIVAAVAKALSPQAFAYALAQVSWIPVQLRPPFAVIIPGLEFSLGAALLIGWRPRLIARMSFFVLILFTAVLIMLPKNLDCGCFGQVSGVVALLSSGWGAISRNVLLLSFTGWLAFYKHAELTHTEEVTHG
jgi:hypothetical protein